MKTRFRKPRFKLIHLTVLIAMLAVVFAFWPSYMSPLVAGFVILYAILGSVIDHRPTALDWLVLAATVFVMIMPAIPPVSPDHSYRKRLATKPPITPTSVAAPLNGP